MADDVLGIIRMVIGYDKIPNKNGNYPMRVEYKLKPLKLSFLQRLFKIDPNDFNPIVRDMIDGYVINEEQAKALQPYVINGVIDLEKYDFLLECYSDE
jgi:hypothetical protein